MIDFHGKNPQIIIKNIRLFKAHTWIKSDWMAHMIETWVYSHYKVIWVLARLPRRSHKIAQDHSTLNLTSQGKRIRLPWVQNMHINLFFLLPSLSFPSVYLRINSVKEDIIKKHYSGYTLRLEAHDRKLW